MTIKQVEEMIKEHFVPKDGVSTDELNELYMTICYGIKKRDELELINDYIFDAKKAGNSRKNTVAMVQFRFAKSKRRAYALVKRSGAYEEG